MDDTAAYEGYETRLYRDASHNTVQIYLDRHSGRAVLLWADALDESAAFTMRDADGNRHRWSGRTRRRPSRAKVARATSRIACGLRSPVSRSGGSCSGRCASSETFNTRRQICATSARRRTSWHWSRRSSRISRGSRHASSGRSSRCSTSRASRRFARGSLPRSRCVEPPHVDGPRRQGCARWQESFRARAVWRCASTEARARGATVEIRALSAQPLRYSIRVTTDGTALTPLSRADIFNSSFLEFLARAKSRGDTSIRYRRLEREVRSVELLSSGEKLMAGLPNYATYFGRDVLMTALMMRSIWTPAMSERDDRERARQALPYRRCVARGSARRAGHPGARGGIQRGYR